MTTERRTMTFFIASAVVLLRPRWPLLNRREMNGQDEQKKTGYFLHPVVTARSTLPTP